MTNQPLNQQELDEILEKVRYAAYYADYHDNHTQEQINLRIAEHIAEQKQAILDWHNKQIEELLDKFEQDCKLNYTTWGNSERMLQVSGILKRIEAERNKLKERDDE